MHRPQSPSLTVDPATGEVRLGDHVPSIDATLTIEALRRDFTAWLDGGRDVGNGHEWVGLSGLRLSERPAWLSLCFLNGRLIMLTIGVSLADDEDEEGWPTEATSRRQVAFLRRVLGRQLGRSMAGGSESFAWGGAWANFDPKGFMASAGLRYEAVPTGSPSSRGSP